MREMKRVYEARAENIAKGHGQVNHVAMMWFNRSPISNSKIAEFELAARHVPPSRPLLSKLEHFA